MRKTFFPVKDAVIYSEFPDRNTGLDEQLEIGKSLHGSRVVRSLVQFDMAVVSASAPPPEAIYELSLYVANAVNLRDGQTIEVCSVSQSWNNGTGYYYQDVIQINDGVTWNSRTSGSLWAVTGSSFNTAPTSSFTLPQPMTDLRIDISSIVRIWLSGSVANNGVVVKFDTTTEKDGTNQGNVKFFSNDTHTIYRPSLIVRWNDQVYSTGSLTAAPIDGLTVIPTTLRPAYMIGETVRVDLACRAAYPLKTFATAYTAYAGQKYLPSSSYFSIVDDQAGTTIIPFTDTALVSTDPSGSYVKFTIENMYPRRYYRLLIKVVANGYTQVFDNAALFTVK